MKQNFDYDNVLVEKISEKKVAMWVKVGPTLLPLVVIFIVCMAYPSLPFFLVMNPVYFLCPPLSSSHMNGKVIGRI